VSLNPDVTWAIRIQGGADDVYGELCRIGLSMVDIDAGASEVYLRLASPGSATVPIRIGGGASRVTILRPVGVATRLNISKGAADLSFDEQRFGAIGGEIQLESPSTAGGTGCYDISIGSGASHLTVATT
jgi:hypothetical protein